MYNSIREDGLRIIRESLRSVMPDEAVRRALTGKKSAGRTVLIAVGKAAWQMAKAAYDCLGEKISSGIVLTKYGHIKGSIGDLILWEAGHPVPDENSFAGTEKALELVRGLTEKDEVIFLLSGGGSALFESPLISGSELQRITNSLLASGADIVEINTIRKRLSKVKGGKFAALCAPASVYSVILSDIVGDPLDMIASGPAAADSSTCGQAWTVVQKYGIELSSEAEHFLNMETPKTVTNVRNHITGSVRELCAAAKNTCEALGYEAHILTDQMVCEAREAGSFLAAVARTYSGSTGSLAFIAGGETIVHLKGKGKGGRNQELALAAAEGLSDVPDALVLSLGSDGTDGPTDAAGGIVDSLTRGRLLEKGISIPAVLNENDAYNALKQVDGLIMTGPTGTNVNDVSVLLLRRKNGLRLNDF